MNESLAATVRQTTEYEQFHAISSLQGWQIDRLGPADPATWPKAWSSLAVRDPGRLPLTELPPVRPLNMALSEALIRRRTSRTPNSEPVPMQTLGDLLGWSLGLRDEPGADAGALRYYPSAGARFPVECHFLALNVEGVPPGACVYSPFEHGFLTYGTVLRDADIPRLLGFGEADPPRVVLILSAAMERTASKYGNRGYRYALVEAGHVMQNLYLTAAALGLPFAAIGGFSDIDARRLVDGLETDEIPLYCAVVP